MGGDAYRMNTVFKFGMQIWTLMALAAAISLPLLLRGLRRIGGEPARAAGLVVLATLIALTALFPLIGIPNRIANRFPVQTGLTLDGLAFLEQAEFIYNCEAFGGCEPNVDMLQIDLRPDAAAIAWLNETITGTPIVLQSNLWFYRAYGIRVAANTGLPTVISALHVDEQRDPTIAQIRNDDIDMLYRTTDLETTLRLLAKYGVNYIYVGSIEHAFYNEAGLAKFAEMEGTYLDQRYTSPGVQIYQVSNIPSVYAEPETYDFAADEPITRPPPPIVEEETDPVEPVPPDEAATTDDSAAPAPPAADLAALEEQVAANPDNSVLAFGLAERYRAAGRLDDAADVLEVAAEANPGDIGLHHLWGDILSEAGRYAEAEAVYMLAARNNPTAGNWNKLATALLGWGELEKAEMALSEALSIDDTAPEPYYRLGQLYRQQGNDEQAISALQAYLQLAPDGPYHQEARQLLAEIQDE
jgi:tetratricopeptide (TPR) repeat protein